MAILDIINTLAPAYSADARIPDLITLAIQQTSTSKFGCKWEYAVALRVCHLIARNPLTGAGTSGAVTSAQEGQVSQSYSIPPELQRRYGDLCSTPYGLQLAQLIEGNIMGAVVAGGPMSSSVGLRGRR